MHEKLRFSQILSISLMLFAIFFGAGNMVFPPSLGQAAGSNMLAALLGFIVTDAGIAILGITAIVLVGNGMSALGELVSKKFAFVLSVGVYLLIGPLFALPRTGSVSFELALLPFLGEGSSTFLFSLLFTAAFFTITYYLSSNPKNIVDIVGKVLTPVLLVTIALIFFGTLLHSGEAFQGGTLGEVLAPSQDYQSIPFFKGMIEGYLALDGPAGLAFAIIVITAIKAQGIQERKNVVKYTCICGLGAAFFLAIVYFALAYVGAVTPGTFANGGALLSSVTTYLFGDAGTIVLGIAVLLACLTTSIGLTTSFADYFSERYPTIRYRKIAFGVCFFSFVIANVGLSQLIAISLPILIMIYPVTVVLMVLSFFKGYIKERRMVYVLGMLFAFVVAFIDGVEKAGMSLGVVSELATYLPFQELGIGWVLPACVGALIGFVIPTKKSNTLMKQK